MYQIIQAEVSICIWGRRTGKTEGPMGDFTVRNLYAMPRGNGLLLGTTYEQILTRTLPPLMAAWERLGLYENKHYWIKKYADARLKLDRAYRHPVEPSHYIHWHNGSGIYLVSQDRPGTINGVQAQWLAGDEARFLNKPRMDEDLLQTLSGHADLWGGRSYYLSKLFCTDMPRSSKGKWLLDYRARVDKEVIDAILLTHKEIVGLKKRYLAASERTQKRMRPKLVRLYEYLNELRRGTVYVSMASTLDNIHVLGLDALKQMKLELSDVDFSLTVLNKEIMKLEGGFYSLLDEDQHGYDRFDYGYIEKLSWEYKKPAMQDCRWDGDIDREEPLNIACDHNNAINCIATGQEEGNEGRLLSTKYVLNPLLLKDMVYVWHDYYKHMPHRDVNYIYDSTSKGGDASTDISFSDEVFTELVKLGWNVNRIDIGQIGSHHSRYFFWGKMLQEHDSRLPRFRYNKSNNKDWIISAQGAGIIKSGEKIKKDKRPEKDTNVLPQHATHLSEAVDILFWGMFRERLNDSGGYVEPMIIA